MAGGPEGVEYKRIREGEASRAGQTGRDWRACSTWPVVRFPPSLAWENLSMANCRRPGAVEPTASTPRVMPPTRSA